MSEEDIKLHGRTAETHLINIFAHIESLVKSIKNESYAEKEIRLILREVVAARVSGEEVYIWARVLFDELARMMGVTGGADDAVVAGLKDQLKTARENLQTALDAVP